MSIHGPCRYLTHATHTPHSSFTQWVREPVFFFCLMNTADDDGWWGVAGWWDGGMVGDQWSVICDQWSVICDRWSTMLSKVKKKRSFNLLYFYDFVWKHCTSMRTSYRYISYVTLILNRISYKRTRITRMNMYVTCCLLLLSSLLMFAGFSWAQMTPLANIGFDKERAKKRRRDARHLSNNVLLGPWALVV